MLSKLKVSSPSNSSIFISKNLKLFFTWSGIGAWTNTLLPLIDLNSIDLANRCNLFGKFIFNGFANLFAYLVSPIIGNPN